MTTRAKRGCDCADPGCPVHLGSSDCPHTASTILYRVDMEDYSGTPFCEECAVDAMDSGVFSTEAQHE